MQLSEKAKALVDKKYENGSASRLKHIYGVAKLSMELAAKYGLDPDKAGAAGYMHDYCKYDDFGEIEKLLTKDEIEECKKYPFLYHAYGSAYMYKKLFEDSFDEDIFNAIYNHVFGRPGMSKLEEIVMISDYCEENRPYPTCQACRKVLLSGNFYQAIVDSLTYTIAHVEEKGEEAHPRQKQVLEEYKNKLRSN